MLKCLTAGGAGGDGQGGGGDVTFRYFGGSTVALPSLQQQLPAAAAHLPCVPRPPLPTRRGALGWLASWHPWAARDVCWDACCWLRTVLGKRKVLGWLTCPNV